MPSNVGAKLAAALRKTPVVLGLTLALLMGPLLLDLFCYPISIQRRLFAYSAPDTFYYLTVARNIGLHGHFSFDGEHLSNGYHPFWQVLVAIPYALRLVSANSIWVLAILLGMEFVLQSAALWLWSRIFRRPDGTLSWLFVALPAGLYALLICPAWLARSADVLSRENPSEGAEPVYGSLWSYFNGMETSLVLFFFALVSYLATRDKPLARPIALGLALTGLVFSRLDQGLIALPILVGIAFDHMRQAEPWRERLKAPAKAALAFGLPLVAYLLLNHFLIGSALPISGRMKSTFPFINFENMDVARRWFNDAIRLRVYRLDDHWRVLQIWIPIFFAVLAPLVVFRLRLRRNRMIITWPKEAPRRGGLLLMTSFGIVALGLYDFLFVLVYGVGHWYFPISTLFVSLLALHGAERLRLAWIARWMQKEETPRRARLRRITRLAIPVMLVATIAALFPVFHRMPNYHLKYAQFALDDGPAFRQFAQENDVKILDCDDGIVAWVANVPAMSATGLGLDPEAAQARTTTTSNSNLMQLAMKRGYFYAATLVYVDMSRLKSGSSRELLTWMSTTGAFLQLGHLNEYTWRLAYLTPKRDFAVLQAKAK
ncbi:MAG TPA: hypothetical protein PK156_16630 [Polyangium sp.]|nr:hypothetical protein [Polyangium sp.]